jgi:hypothetical protein
MGCLSWVLDAWAFGALAVGVPQSIREDGIAMGVSWNMPTAQSAEREARKQCAEFQAAPVKTRALCKVIRTFERKCAAIASDPAPGGEEWGWAVGDSASQAEQLALRSCKTNHLQFCIIAASGCDGGN